MVTVAGSASVKVKADGVAGDRRSDGEDQLMSEQPAGRTGQTGHAVDFVGRGFAWPLRVDHTGSIALTDGAADLDAAIRMVLLTAPGERVMRPQFGCRIWDLLFEPVTANLLGLMARGRARRARPVGAAHRGARTSVPVQDDDDSGLVRIDDRLPGQGDQRPPQPGLPVLRDPPRGRPDAARPARTSTTARFQDIVDEAKRLIPRSRPEWTNHNLSDPGVALIELFAWMSEMVLFRVNQVPDRLYVHFLNLVGIEPFPPSVARADLTFWLSAAGRRARSWCPPAPRSRPTAVAGDARPWCSATSARLVIEPPELRRGPHVDGGHAAHTTDVWDDLRVPGQDVVCFPSSPLAAGDAFYLGIRELAGAATRCGCDIDRRTPRASASTRATPPLVWEVWNGEAWVAVTVEEDSHRRAQPGRLRRRARGPRARAARCSAGASRTGCGSGCCGRSRASRRTRRRRGSRLGARSTPSAARCPPSTRRASPAEVLGRSTASPGRSSRSRPSPSPRAAASERVLVVDRPGTTGWTEVADFSALRADRPALRLGLRDGRGAVRARRSATPTARSASTARSRATAAEIRSPATARAAAPGATSVRARSRPCASAVPFVASVTNLTAATGGVDAETVARGQGPRAADPAHRPAGRHRGRLRAGRAAVLDRGRAGALPADRRTGAAVGSRARRAAGAHRAELAHARRLRAVGPAVRRPWPEPSTRTGSSAWRSRSAPRTTRA